MSLGRLPKVPYIILLLSHRTYSHGTQRLGDCSETLQYLMYRTVKDRAQFPLSDEIIPYLIQPCIISCNISVRCIAGIPLQPSVKHQTTEHTFFLKQVAAG